jgi:outer membrane protein TolC
MIRIGLILCLLYFLTACAVTPQPISVNERYEEAKTDIKQLFAQQQPFAGKLDFYEALARGLKYNLDYRIKLVNNALQAGQLKVAMFTMFPSVNASGSVYARNNQYASSGITSAGSPTDVLNSTPNTVRSARMGLSWNILDFGLC